MRINKKQKMIGKRYGKLVVLSITKDNRCVCRCDCGAEKIINATNVRSGRSKSCGCGEKEAREKRKVDLTGQVFGYLTALEPTTQRKDGNVVWKCKCICGTICYVTSRSLIRGDKGKRNEIIHIYLLLKKQKEYVIKEFNKNMKIVKNLVWV